MVNLLLCTTVIPGSIVTSTSWHWFEVSCKLAQLIPQHFSSYLQIHMESSNIAEKLKVACFLVKLVRIQGDQEGLGPQLRYTVP